MVEGKKGRSGKIKGRRDKGDDKVRRTEEGGRERRRNIKEWAKKQGKGHKEKGLKKKRKEYVEPEKRES
jgi:hypothetical protein